MSLFFSNLLGSGSSASQSEGKVNLPLTDEEAASTKMIEQSERAEFRIEGMTCGACVEVCTPYKLLHDNGPHHFRRQ